MPDPELLAQLRKRLGTPPPVSPDATAAPIPRGTVPGRPDPTQIPLRPAGADPRTLSRAVNFIAGHEGFRERAYKDMRGRGQPWTVGYGRTGEGVDSLTQMTEPEARQWLEQRVEQDAKRLMAAGVEPHPSILSFIYNAGYGRLRSSGALDAALRNDWQGVADAMMTVTRGRDAQNRSVVLPGLVRRRREEVDMLQDLLEGTDTPRGYSLEKP